jgi:glycosyltransferase involved in cell wall biosynthesis
MRIGVDAGALGITDGRLKLGVYWVNVHLLRELAKIDTKNSYTLYSFAPIDKKLMDELGPRMTNKVLRPVKGWMSLRVPFEMALRPVDVFLGLSQAIPVSRTRSIGFIYDLGFLHNPSSYPGSQRKLKQITKSVIRRSYSIVTISETVKKDIVAIYHADPKDITVAYPGVDKTFVPIGKKHEGEHPYFLFVGALKRGKNIPGLLRGFAKFLESQNKPYDLYLGGGEYWKDPEITKEIERLGLGKSVNRLGYVPDAELASYYRGAVAFVSPSLYEGFGLPAAESMACGTPVIGSTTGALPEIVGDGGICVDPYDYVALSHAMLMMTNLTTRDAYAKKALIQAKKFNWRACAKKVFELL